ncbi:MAG TPA: hypothetical protein VF026_29155 [Ktedonobacteraceae bacterium]
MRLNLLALRCKKKLIIFRRGEGGAVRLGAAFIAFMVARVLFPWAPILQEHDPIPTGGRP